MWQGRSASAINLLFPKPSRDTLRLMVCARCALLARMRKVCSSDIGLPDGLKSSFSRKPPKMHPSSDSCAVPKKQVKDYLFCGDYEQSFGRAETWIKLPTPPGLDRGPLADDPRHLARR